MSATLASCSQALRAATWTVLASEAMMFAALFVVHGSVRSEPIPGELVLATITAAALVSASVVLAAALRRVRSQHPERATSFFAAVIALGGVALVAELFVARLVTPRDLLGTTILGLHAAHVAAAMTLVGWSAALARARRVRRGRCLAIEIVAVYWYFVTALWIVIGPIVAA